MNAFADLMNKTATEIGLKNSSFASLLYHSKFIPDNIKLIIYNRTSRLFSSSTENNLSPECTSLFTIGSKEDKNI